MTNWNSLLEDPLFNTGLGLLSGAATDNPWAAATEQLNRYQALRQNREQQQMHAKLYEAQARKAEQEALEAEQARADAERNRAALREWAKTQDPRIRALIEGGVVGPKDLSQEASKTLFPTLNNEERFDPATGLPQRVLRDPRSTDAIPFGGTKKEAPPPSTNVMVGGPQLIMPKDLSQGIVSKLSDSQTKAEGAVQSIMSLDQLEGALRSGKVRLGPGASLGQALDQIGLMLGYGGKTAAERVSNTRLAIQGLAQQELGAAGQMRGQGTITENERDIIRRAAAGDIDSLSAPELQILIPALRKTANYRLTAHQKMVEQTEREHPGSSVYFGVQAPAPAPAPEQTENAPIRLKRVNGKLVPE